MIADFYVCPKCLYIEFGEVAGEELKFCPKCSSKILQVYASSEAQHLIMDIWKDYGSEFASIAAIVLAVLNYTTSEYATLSVEVRNDIGVLKEDELIDILRKKDIAREVIKILRENIAPPEPVIELSKRV